MCCALNGDFIWKQSFFVALLDRLYAYPQRIWWNNWIYGQVPLFEKLCFLVPSLARSLAHFTVELGQCSPQVISKWRSDHVFKNLLQNSASFHPHKIFFSPTPSEMLCISIISPKIIIFPTEKWWPIFVHVQYTKTIVSTAFHFFTFFFLYFYVLYKSLDRFHDFLLLPSFASPIYNPHQF